MIGLSNSKQVTELKADCNFFWSLRQQFTMPTQHVLAREKSKKNKILMKNVGNYTINVPVL